MRRGAHLVAILGVALLAAAVVARRPRKTFIRVNGQHRPRIAENVAFRLNDEGKGGQR